MDISCSQIHILHVINRADLQPTVFLRLFFKLFLLTNNEPFLSADATLSFPIIPYFYLVDNLKSSCAAFKAEPLMFGVLLMVAFKFIFLYWFDFFFWGVFYFFLIMIMAMVMGMTMAVSVTMVVIMVMSCMSEVSTTFSFMKHLRHDQIAYQANYRGDEHSKPIYL